MGHTPRPPSPSNHSTFGSHSSHGYDQSFSDAASTYSYDQPSLHPQSVAHYAQPPYQSQYEPPPSAYPQSSTSRGPRHSIPATSSGFIPLPHPSDATGFGPPASAYNTSQFHAQPMYTSQTPAPTNTDVYLPPSSSGSFMPQGSFPQSQPFQYAPGFSTSTISQGYTTTPAPQQLPLTQGVTPQAYQAYASTPSPSRDGNGYALLPSTSLPSTLNVGSRPLPQQPHMMYAQQIPPSYSLPPSNTFSPPQSGNTFSSAITIYQPPPPPPPIPHPVDQSSQQVFVSNGRTANGLPPPPPPPPPHLYASTSSGRQSTLPQLSDTSNGPRATGHTPSPSQSISSSSRRHSSLPQPPIMYQQSQPAYQPPLPPPPRESFNKSPLPPPPPPPPPRSLVQTLPYHPGPPPNPPPQLDAQGQWIPPVHTGYMQQGYV